MTGTDPRSIEGVADDDLTGEELRTRGLAAMAEYQEEYGRFSPAVRSAAAERVDVLMGWSGSR